MRWIARVVREQSPQQMKFPYALWTLSLIRYHYWTSSMAFGLMPPYSGG